MKQKRRNHSAEFKARVALEAIKGVKTVQQIAAENHLHPVQVTQWKGQMLESAAGIFSRGRGREDGSDQEGEGAAGAQGGPVGRGGGLVEKKSARSWGSDP